MERDAAPPLSPADALPPHPPDSARLVGVAGVALCAVAAVLAGVSLGLDGTPLRAVNVARVVLAFVGVVTAGAAISMRPDLWWVWGLGSVAAALGVFGLPGRVSLEDNGWDSFRALFAVLSVLAGLGAALCAASFKVRVGVSVAVILFHFTGIFMAATAPPPRPWVNEQMFGRLYNPYLQFIYLRNAYQFYSPNPGPASIIVCLLKTETGTDERGRKQYKTQWVVIPRRPADIRDPMGLSYYRRISLTQQIAHVNNAALEILTDASEKFDVIDRRTKRSTAGQPGHIPFFPPQLMRVTAQYAIPGQEVARFVIPSYASHVIMEHAYEDAARTTVKMYRLDHMTLTADEYRTKLPNGQHADPYQPGTYRPYFLGEFNARGELIDPQEPFLYWLIPVLPRHPGVNDPNQKTYEDYLSVHALGMSIDEVMKADEKDGRVFQWGQLKWSETR